MQKRQLCSFDVPPVSETN